MNLTNPPGLSLDSSGLATGHSSPLAPALLSDMARMFRQLGVESFRASVVDMGSMNFQAAWTITDNGEVSDNSPDRPLDSQFPGAMATIAQLGQAPLEETMVQRLSPRRWSFAWRIDGLHVVIAEARYRDIRAAVGDIDTAMVRLVCDTGIRASQSAGHAPDDPDDDDGGLVWPSSRERRQRRGSALLSPQRLGLAFTALSALLALWLLLVALPSAQDSTADAQGYAARLRTMADKTLVQGLSTALATGDYGEVQNELSAFEGLGYFRSAAVTNTSNRVVSLTNPIDGLRIGEPLPPKLAEQARTMVLALGNERYGQLHVLKAADLDNPAGHFTRLKVLALGAFACAALGTGFLLMRLRKARRVGD